MDSFCQACQAVYDTTCDIFSEFLYIRYFIIFAMFTESLEKRETSRFDF